MTEESNAALAEETVSETEVETVEIVETEVEATSEATEESAPQTTEDTSGKDADGVQKRINKITAEKYEQKRRADELEKRLQALETQEKSKPVDKPIMPTQSDYDYDDDKYNAAMAEYQSNLVDYQVQQTLAKQREQEKGLLESQKQAELQANFNKKVAESNIEGYADAIQTLPIFDPSVTTAIMQAENGVNIAWYLSQHLDQADVLASSDPISAAMHIGEISARLKAATKQTKPSAAPEPVKPINQGGAAISESESELIAGATFE